MGNQHYLLIAFQLNVLLLIYLVEYEHVVKKSVNYVAGLVMGCRYVMMIVLILMTALQKNNIPFYTPVIRSDMESLHQMEEYLNSLTQDNEDKIYVLASGHVLNSSILKAIEKPNDFEPIKGLLDTNDYDMRDGFPEQFLDASVIVVTDPIELHLAEGTQEVVRFLAQEILDNTSTLGKNYEMVQEFELQKGVVAKVYKKIDCLDEEDIKYIREYYHNYYPEFDSIMADRIYID